MTRLIDADALKEQFKDRSLEDFTHLHFIDAINNAPTVDRPQGEWIEEAVPVGLIGRGNRQRRCSLCGHRDIQAKTQEVPYCWFCGAEMRC